MESFLVELLRDYGYPILFVWSMLEGELGLIMAGLLVHDGSMELYTAIAVAGLGSFFIDQIWFYTGRYNKTYINKKLKSHRRKFALAHKLLQKYGWFIIFVQRFIYGLRTIIPMSIGTTRYSAKLFGAINFISGFVWAALTIVPVSIFGEEILTLYQEAKKYWYLIVPIGIISLGSLIFYFRIKTKKKRLKRL